MRSFKIKFVYNLESVSLLCSERAMPLDEVVVRPVQVLVQLDHQRLEERRELTLHLQRHQWRSVPKQDIN